MQNKSMDISSSEARILKEQYLEVLWILLDCFVNSDLTETDWIGIFLWLEFLSRLHSILVSALSFGSLDSGVEVKRCLPTKNVENMVGRMKGIQGFRNSCYLDTTLYAMFVQSTAFDRSVTVTLIQEKVWK